MASPPELQAPEIYYNDEEARKYTSSSRIIDIQAKLSERALELLALPDDSIPKLLLGIGCGSGLNGETLTKNGHHWLGLDVSESMLNIAPEQEVEGNFVLGDMEQGLGLRPGVFDGAISISAVKWLCNAGKSSHEPRIRLMAFFGSLYRCLTRGGRAVLQVYPENLPQREVILGFAMRAGFSGGVVVDYPHSAEIKKRNGYLVLTCGPPSLSNATAMGKGADGENCTDEDSCEEEDQSEKGTQTSSVASTTPSSSSLLVRNSSNLLVRNSGDIGWKYARLVDPNNKDWLQCILCNKLIKSGISRVKKHIAGIRGEVVKCPKATEEDKKLCKNAIDEVRRKKKGKMAHGQAFRNAVRIEDQYDNMKDEVDCEVLESRKRPRFLEPMDRFTNAVNTVPSTSILKQENINSQMFHDKVERQHMLFAHWVYSHGIPFSAVDNDDFLAMMEEIGQFGPGYRQPTQCMLRESLLTKSVDVTKDLLKNHEEEWDRTGCTLMIDAWSDVKRRSIINVCVNCRLGTTFISSKETFGGSYNGQFIFEYVDHFIDQIGSDKVIQVISDNASNMAAKALLIQKRPRMFWTPCATHTINLMLEDIGQKPRFRGIIDKAKALTIFIYAHHDTLEMMRRYTGNRDIVRPGVTRFATSFLTLQSLVEKKEALKLMFTSSEWDKSKWPRMVKGKQSCATVLSSDFWQRLTRCLKVFAPLVNVLRLIDGDIRPTMGFIYGELKKAKLDMRKGFKSDESVAYERVIEIVDERGKDRIDTSLHLTAYLLNPYYRYRDATTLDQDAILMEAFFDCIDHFCPDNVELQVKIVNELRMYKMEGGNFETPDALKDLELESYDPVDWWDNYGLKTPHLMSMAMKILALNSSASGCERNWSNFEQVQFKRRNKLDTSMLNNLVYCQFNNRLLNNNRKRRNKEIDILASDDCSRAQAWLVDISEEDEDLDSRLPLSVVSEAIGASGLKEPGRSTRNSQEVNDEEME